MSKRTSEYEIEGFDADWGDNPNDHLPQSGRQVNTFLNTSLKELPRAAYFDETNYNILYFRSQEDKESYIESPSQDLVLFSVPLSFTGTVKRVVITNYNEKTQINAVTNMEDVSIEFGYALQQKSVTDPDWDTLEIPADITVYADSGNGYQQIAVYHNVEHGDDPITLNVRPHLIAGKNKIKVTAIAQDDNHTSANLVYNILLADMYVENFENRSYWYRAVVEGETSPTDYALGGFRIVGELSKTLCVDIYESREATVPIKQLTKTIGSTQYINYPYSFNQNDGLNLNGLDTGSYIARVYLTSGTGEGQISTKDNYIEYPFMYVKYADRLTAQIVVVHDIEDMVFNATTARLCDFAIYDGRNSEAAPVRTMQQYIGQTEYGDPQVFDSTVPTQTIQTFEAEVNIEDESTEYGYLKTVFSVELGSAEAAGVNVVDNSSSYPAMGGYDFSLNPVLRRNGETNPQRIINDVDGTVYDDAVWTNMSFVDGIDGWTKDSEGANCLRIAAGGRMTLPVTDFQFLSSANQGKLTLDLCYRIENVSDKSEPCITIATNADTDGFTGIKILPDRVLVHSSVDTSATNDTNRGTHVMEGETLHLMIAVEPNYSEGMNLVTGYLNGCVAFQFQYSGNFNIPAALVIGSDSADVNIYSLKHYPSSQRHDAAEANFVASIRDREAKIAEHDRMMSVINSSHEITIDKIREAGLNYYVVEMLNGSSIPSKKNGWAKESTGKANIEMHFGDHPEWSFRIKDVETSGQGTTSMDYWLWNMRHRIDKSNSDKKCNVAYWDTASGTWGADTLSKTVRFDGEEHPAVKRITAKINFASSMQSHKMGATYAYNELHNEIFNGLLLNDVQQAAKEAGDPIPAVAVYQYPAFGFSKVGDDYTFIGLFTVGPDKGDKPTFGYDSSDIEDTLISMEGPDHTPRLTMFQYPWNSNVGYVADEEKLCIVSGSSPVDGEGGWEVGNCGPYATDDQDDESNVDTMLRSVFKPAYDAAYENSTLIFPIGLNDNSPWAGATAEEVLANVNADIAGGGTFTTTSYGTSRFKHLDMEFWIEGEYILYHYDPITGQYVAGADLVEQCGTPEGDTLDAKNEWFKTKRRQFFMESAPDYWNIDEAIYNLVFILLFGATDNCGKNMYPYYMSETGKWCFRQDDLDTIFDIDNNGGDTKNYWLEFEDTDNGGGLLFGGGASVFWNLIAECYMDDYDGGTKMGIRSYGAEVLDCMKRIAGGANVYDGALEYIRHRFWNKAQYYFPVSAYNSDDSIKYLDAWLNEPAHKVDPLTQALGNHEQAERRWVEYRLLYTMSLFRVGPFKDYTDTTFGQIAFRPSSLPSLTLTMAAWLYPQVLVGQAGNKGTERIADGGTITFTNFSGAGQTSHYIKAADFITSLGDLCKLVLGAQDGGRLTINAKRLKDLKIGDVDASQMAEEANITSLSLDCPSLEEIDARNSHLAGSLDLRNCKRILSVLLENTEVSAVQLRDGSKIETLHLPATITALKFIKTKYLNDLTVANWAGITSLELRECNALSNMGALVSAYTAENSQLREVALKWDNLDQITAAIFKMLAEIAGKVSTRTMDVNMEGQMKLDQGHYAADFEALQFQEVTPSTMEGYKEGLSTIFNHPLRLFYKDIVYKPFVDPEVLRVLISHGVGTSEGITAEQFANLTSISTWFRNNTVVTRFPELNEAGITSLAAFAFDGCTNLVIDELSLPNLQSMGYRALGNVKVKNITNLGSITAFGAQSPWMGMFEGNTYIESIVLPVTLKRLSLRTFSGASSLRSINLEHIEAIEGTNVFSGCTNLHIELNLPNLNANGFNRTPTEPGQFVNCGITKIVSLGSVTSLPSDGGFWNRAVFVQCTSLTDVTLPATLTNIGYYNFYKCTNLVNVTVLAVTPPQFGSRVFDSCPNLLHIYVPADSVEAYKAASGWSSFASKISAIPTEE